LYSGLAQKGSPGVRTSGLCFRKQAIFQLILAVIFFAGCAHKTVRVAVSDADIKKANEVSQEGDLAFSRKDYYAALIKYLEAARLNPNNENILNRMGIAYAQLKLYDEANKAFQVALDLNPKFSFAYNNLGSVAFLQRNLGRAERCFRRAVSLKSDEASFHVNLGSLYLEKKKPRQAMAEWARAMALDPEALTKSSAVSLTGSGSVTPAERMYYIARFYASTGNTEGAIENLKLAFNGGFSKFEAIANERDFDPVRKDARFVEFLKEISLLVKLRDKTGLPSGENTPSR